ncbi:tyrosine-type recombinase/integrase [Paraburkholderia sp. Cpub6]|uniref:tyrosine-type recombinase/integrase n=1 Tax=Paraburkholderia sp. Cpub6 TaxID=2723094 RepID=UPI00161B2460|nr:tyrosine-type recombinase/integrase [Paraburkholderia sp. Cpub6]MBB5461039.1 integrase [Paraburkholderia sp. Cpub6]
MARRSSDENQRANTGAPAVAVKPLPFEDLAEAPPCAYEKEQRGYNRAPSGMCKLGDALTDMDALIAWLRTYDDAPRTQRAYRKELDRFCGWLTIFQRKGLASVRTEDIEAYDEFLTAPHPDWCGKRYGRRSTADWHPFEGPLSERSRTYARKVIGVFFGWLVAIGYLVRDPFVVSHPYHGQKNHAVRNQAASTTSVLTLSAFRRFANVLQKHVDSIDPSDRWKKAKAERELFTLRFLANTGLCRDELPRVCLRDIRLHENRLTGAQSWTMKIGGKNITRIIAVNEAALSALQRYRRALGASEHFIGNESPLLLPVWGEQGAHRHFLTDQIVYDDVRAAVKIAQQMIAPTDPSFALLLGNVTPHSFRHTCAKILEELGVKPRMIQLQLGTELFDTTRFIESAAELTELVEAMASLQI